MKTKSKVLSGCFILIAIVAIGITLGIAAKSCDNSNNATPGKNGIDTLALELYAKSIAEASVKQLLKAPASAEFPSDQQHYLLQADSTIIIKGAVDSQNAFGAMLRTTFYVSMKWKADFTNSDNWQVLESFLDE
jgi:hypothetical protein